MLKKSNLENMENHFFEQKERHQNNYMFRSKQRLKLIAIITFWKHPFWAIQFGKKGNPL